MYKTSYDRNRNGGRNGPAASFDVEQIVLADKLPPDLFSRIAEDAAKYAAESDGKKAGKFASKPTQLRKFYDEICMWHGKVQDDEQLDEFLPFILMLKAKVAYSEGRKHVNKQYALILNHCLDQIEKTPKRDTLRHLKLFMEAFTGFYKVHGPK